MNERFNATLARLDREIQDLKKQSIQQKPKSWSMFERETVADHWQDTVADMAMKLGRTKLSVKWEIYRQLRDELIG